MRTRAGSSRNTASKDLKPNKPPASKGRRVFGTQFSTNAPGSSTHGDERKEHALVAECAALPEESDTTKGMDLHVVQANETPAVVLAAASPLVEKSDQKQQQQEQKKQQIQLPKGHAQMCMCPPCSPQGGQLVIMDQHETPASEGVTADVAGDHCCSLPLGEGAGSSALDTAPAPPGTGERSSSIVHQHQGGASGHEIRRGVRRSTRCLSMSAAVVSGGSSAALRKTRSRSSTSSSFVRVGRPVEITGYESRGSDAASLGSGGGDTPPELSTPPACAPGPALAPEMSEDFSPGSTAARSRGTPLPAEERSAGLTPCRTTTTSIARRASVSCRANESGQASLRRRPCSMGSSKLALHGSLSVVRGLSPVREGAGINVGGTGTSLGAVDDPTDSLAVLPAPSQEPAVPPPDSTGESGNPASNGSSVGSTTPSPHQQQKQRSPSPTGPLNITAVCEESLSAARPLALPAPDTTPIGASRSDAGACHVSPMAEKEPLTTPRLMGGALFGLVDYDSSPSGAGSPPVPSRVDPTASLPVVGSPAAAEARATRPTECALTGLVDYDLTPPPPPRMLRSSPQSLMGHECFSAASDEGVVGDVVPDGQVERGAPEEGGRAATDEAPATVDVGGEPFPQEGERGDEETGGEEDRGEKKTEGKEGGGEEETERKEEKQEQKAIDAPLSFRSESEEQFQGCNEEVQVPDEVLVVEIATAVEVVAAREEAEAEATVVPSPGEDTGGELLNERSPEIAAAGSAQALMTVDIVDLNADVAEDPAAGILADDVAADDVASAVVPADGVEDSRLQEAPRMATALDPLRAVEEATADEAVATAAVTGEAKASAATATESDGLGAVEENATGEVVMKAAPSEGMTSAHDEELSAAAAGLSLANVAIPEELVVEDVNKEASSPRTAMERSDPTLAEQSEICSARCPASAAALPAVGAVPQSDEEAGSAQGKWGGYERDVEEVRPLRRSGRRRSIAPRSAFASKASSSQKEIPIGAALRDDRETDSVEGSRPPRRNGRRRSIAPKKAPPAEAPIPAPISAAAPSTSTTADAAAAAASAIILPAARRPAADPTSPRPSPSSACAAAVSDGHDTLLLEGVRPPRRSGRRRSIAPSRAPSPASAPPPAPAPPTAAAAPPAAGTASESCLSAGEGSANDRAAVLDLKGLSSPPPAPPLRSGRRRSVAVRRRVQDGPSIAPLLLSSPSSIGAGDSCGGAVVAAAAAAAVGDVPSFEAVGSVAASEKPVAAVAPTPDDTFSARRAPPARRRSARRKSIRGGSRAQRSLLEDVAAPLIEAPVATSSAPEVCGGGGGPSVAAQGSAAVPLPTPPEDVSLPGQQAQPTRRSSARRKSLRGLSRSGGSLLEEASAPPAESPVAVPSVKEACSLASGVGDGGGGGGGGGGGDGFCFGGDAPGTGVAEKVPSEGKGTARSVLEDARIGDGEGSQPRAVMAALLEKCLEVVAAEVSPADPVLQPLVSLCSALADAEASCIASVTDEEGGIDDERERAAGVAKMTAAGNAAVGSTASKSKSKSKSKSTKHLRWCAFDFSTVSMPLDTTVGSERRALRVVDDLERVVAAQHNLQEFLRARGGEGEGGGGGSGDGGGDSKNANADGGGGGRGGGGGGPAAWDVLLRELRSVACASNTVAVSGGERAGGSGGVVADNQGLEPAVPTARVVAVARGGEGDRRAHQDKNTLSRDRERSRAALFILEELEQLEKGPEGGDGGRPVGRKRRSAVKERLAIMLSSLIRFNLRIRLDAPPEKLTRGPVTLPCCGDPSFAEEKRRAEVSPPSHFSKVHKVVEASETDATLGAAFSKALLRLDGFSREIAEKVFTSAEAFLGSDQTRLAERDDGCGGGDGCPTARVESARRLLSAMAEVVDAVRARKFVLSLLEFEGVEEAIAEAGGWNDVETWASSLAKLRGSADVDSPLTLLSDVRELKDWLRSGTDWRHGTVQLAETTLRRLLDLRVFRDIAEKPRQRWMCPEAYQLLRQDIFEARDRFVFPEMKKARPVGMETEVTKSEAKIPAEAEAEAEVKPAAIVKQSAGKGKCKEATATPAGENEAPASKDKKTSKEKGEIKNENENENENEGKASRGRRKKPAAPGAGAQESGRAASASSDLSPTIDPKPSAAFPGASVSSTTITTASTTAIAAGDKPAADKPAAATSKAKGKSASRRKRRASMA